MSEVHDRHETLSDWRPDGSQPAGDLPFMEDELCPPDAFEDLEPDEQYFHEATGNEAPPSSVPTAGRPWCCGRGRGGSPSSTRRAWPSLCPTWANCRALDSKGEGSIALWREAHELSGHMLRAWPRQVGWYPGRTEARSDAATLLTLLSQLQDAAHIDTFLDILAAGAYSKGDNAAIVRAVGLLPPAGCGVARAPHRQPGRDELKRVRRPLSRSVVARVAGRAADLSRAAHTLVEALPGDPARTPQRDPWGRSLPVEPGFLVDLLTALGQIDVALAGPGGGLYRPGPRPTSRMPSSSPRPGSEPGRRPSGRGGGAAPAHGGPGAPARPYRRTAGAATRLGRAALSRARVRIAAASHPGGSRPPALDV